MTDKEQNKIASILLQFLEGQHNQEAENVANNSVDMVKIFLEEFPEIDEKIDGYFSQDGHWDDLIYYLKLKK